MIGCEAARRLMDLRLDGEIGPAEAIELEVHLNGCTSCREVASGLEAVAAGLLRIPLEKMPDEDFRAVLDRTVGVRSSRAGSLGGSQAGSAGAVPGARASRRRSYLALAAAVLAATLLVPFAIWYLTPSDPANLTAAEVDEAAREARMVLAVAAKAVRSAETTARDRVIGGEVSPAIRHVPVRWNQVAPSRRNGA